VRGRATLQVASRSRARASPSSGSCWDSSPRRQRP
jgi:hypothetical protein